jgi:hypothetical protein
MQLISFSCWIWCCFPSRECRARCLGFVLRFRFWRFSRFLAQIWSLPPPPVVLLDFSSAAAQACAWFRLRLCPSSVSALLASGFFNLTSVLVPLVLLFDFVSRCRVLAVAACSWSHKIFPCSRFCGRHRSEIRCAPAIPLVTGQISSRSVLQGISSLGFSPALECRRVLLCL